MAYKRKYSKYNRRSRRSGKFGRKMRKGRFVAKVKKVLMRVAETKNYNIANENQQLYHNTGTTGYSYVGPVLYNPWRSIPLGTNNHQRVGDEIYPRGMRMRLWMANKLDRPNVLYRVIVAILPKQYNGLSVSAGSIDIGRSFQQGANGNYITMPIDVEKGIKVLYDKVHRNELGFCHANSGNSAKECHIFKKLWIKRKRSSKISWEPVGVEITNKPLAVYVIPYDSYGTLTTDNIASCAWATTLYYKDV